MPTCRRGSEQSRPHIRVRTSGHRPERERVPYRARTEGMESEAGRAELDEPNAGSHHGSRHGRRTAPRPTPFRSERSARRRSSVVDKQLVQAAPSEPSGSSRKGFPQG